MAKPQDFMTFISNVMHINSDLFQLFAERAHHSIEYPQDSSTFENMSGKTKDTRINITSNPISSDLSSSERSSSRSRPHRHRLLHKNGKVNLRPYRVPLKKERFLADFFTSIIDAKWRWVIAIYSAGFIFSWSFFGTAWFAIFWLRLHYDNGTVCVDNVDSWTSAFLFSVETQTTIGYGGRQVLFSSFVHFFSVSLSSKGTSKFWGCNTCQFQWLISTAKVSEG